MYRFIRNKTALGMAIALFLWGGMAVNAYAANCDVFIIDGASQNGTWSGASPDVWTPNGTSPSLVSATEIQGKLASGSVTIETGACASGSGDITVNKGISWSADNALKLNATGSVNINAEIKATGTSPTLELGADDMSGTLKTKLTPTGFVGKVSLPAGATLKIKGETYNIITALSGLTMSSNYALGADIALSSDHTPIGDSGDAFTGVFDGLGHSITGLQIAAASGSAENLGLFGVVGAFMEAPGVVRNLSGGDQCTQWHRGQHCDCQFCH